MTMTKDVFTQCFHTPKEIWLVFSCSLIRKRPPQQVWETKFMTIQSRENTKKLEFSSWENKDQLQLPVILCGLIHNGCLRVLL